jgi:hypothetical protein
MIRLQKLALAALAAGCLALPGLALAYGDGTPDGQPPAEEVICDPGVGLQGAGYGLCVAYCEANDCDIQPDEHACEVLLTNFYHATGRTDVPCILVYSDGPQ